ncbi:MarR family transcriptional regulator [Bacillus songklensis]|uniref:MarR family transcriptional regulator n=1 Tax=Bacillus songklensis TaxID=1069116 RepID=A0ABV8B264_9BACI
MFQEIERKARLRDIENEKVLTEEELRQANELQAKANARGMKLVPERRVKNRAKFAQFIQENWQYLNSIKYLTPAEKTFLLDIMPYVGFKTNCLVEDIHAKAQMPLTQEGLSQKIGKHKADVSKLLKRLEKKYIVFRGQTGSDEYNAISHSIYINPNILYCGDRDNVSEHLFTMFPRQPKLLKDMPINLLARKS